MKKEALISLALLGLSQGGDALASGNVKNKERCFGVAKKGANDCGTKHHMCAGQAKFDNQKDEWIYVGKGICEKLAGGSLKPQEDPRLKKKK